MFEPRPKQEEVLAYGGGKMGVAAVPGSGKTHTLSALAARLVRDGNLGFDREVLIVTLVNSAVDNFSRRVRAFMGEYGLLPVGYRVRTLHGLAHDIVRERPGLVGLADDFQIVDDTEAERILRDAAQAWLGAHPGVADDFLSGELDDRKAEWVRRDHWPTLVADLASAFVRTAKDLQCTPDDLRAKLDALPAPLPLLEMGWAVYDDYQRSLAYRGGVDYTDLIRLALRALQLDADFLERLRWRWPYILEDEAQDSSKLQEDILRLLAGPGGNWVRVGDPNQAIFETFTTASPKFLRDFLKEADVAERTLPNSGRSTQSIIDLANTLAGWSQTDHPNTTVRERESLGPPQIEPTPPGDPQPNPPDDPAEVHLMGRRYTPEEELNVIVSSLARWLPEHGDQTVAVLTPSNARGERFVAVLKERGIPHFEMLRSTSETRQSAGALGTVLDSLANPTSASKLALAYKAWRREDRDDAESNLRLNAVMQALRRCTHVEEFIWPRTGEDAACIAMDELEREAAELLLAFREIMRRWQTAVVLPIDQLILTVAQDLFDRPADLALAHKLAVVLRQLAESRPEWQLEDTVRELAIIARNKRKFLGFAEAETGFDPEAHRGTSVVTTAHKAKGLEWDRVYLTSVNNYDFPSALPGDEFIAEKWFIRDRLNLEAEALAQLKAVIAGDLDAAYAPSGEATRAARVEYAAERLRLLYVGITRAKRSLILTWNSGKLASGGIQAAVPFIALRTWWEGRHAEGEEP